MTTIVSDYMRDTKVTVGDIKRRLAARYEELSKTHSSELIKAFSIGGKKKIATQFKNGKASMEALVYNESYYLSNMDIIVISQSYKVPLVIFSSTVLPENKSPFLLAYSDNDAMHYFLKAPGVQQDAPMKYKLVASEQGGLIKTSALRGEIANFVKNKSSFDNVETILTTIAEGSSRKQK